DAYEGLKSGVRHQVSSTVDSWRNMSKFEVAVNAAVVGTAVYSGWRSGFFKAVIGKAETAEFAAGAGILGSGGGRGVFAGVPVGNAAERTLLTQAEQAAWKDRLWSGSADATAQVPEFKLPNHFSSAVFRDQPRSVLNPASRLENMFTDPWRRHHDLALIKPVEA